MSKKKIADLFGDDESAQPTSEFEALLNQSSVPHRRLKAGDRLRGEILAVNGAEAFVSTGTPRDATMPFNPANEPPKVGDVVDCVVVRATEAEIIVRNANQRGGGPEAENLEDAFDMELPVEGVVLEVVKGGFRVKVHGEKAFCPISQIDWQCKVPEDYVGRKFQFVITRMERGRDLVVSRRKLLEQERAGAEGAFLNEAKEGDIFTATIFRIEKYGAFARLETGIEGLIPIGELSFSRINHPQEVVNLDQVVQVKLIQMSEEGTRLRISLSIKQGGSVVDPWESIQTDFPVGTTLDGMVERKEPFGLFVNLAPGISGLLPRSSYRDLPEAKDVEKKVRGDRLKVRVDRLDLDARKISLSLPREEEDETWRGHEVTTGQATGGFGTFGDLLKNLKR